MTRSRVDKQKEQSSDHDRRPSLLAVAAVRPGHAESASGGRLHPGRLPDPGGLPAVLRLAVRERPTARLPTVVGSLPCCAGGKYCRPASGDRRAGPEAIPPGRADRRRAGDRRGVGRDGRDGCGDVAAAEWPNHDDRHRGAERTCRPHRQRAGGLGRAGGRQGGAERGEAGDQDGAGLRGGLGHRVVRGRPNPDQQPRRERRAGRHSGTPGSARGSREGRCSGQVDHLHGDLRRRPHRPVHGRRGRPVQ